MRFRAIALILGAVMLLSASTATAYWFDDFDGGFDQTWTFGNVTGTGGSSGTFTAGILSNYLELQDPTSAALGGAAAGFGVVSESYADASIFGTLNPNGDSNMNGDIGLLLRTNVVAGTGYVLTVDYNSGSIDISRLDAFSPTGLATGSITGLNASDTIYAVFSMKDTDLIGLFYDQPGGNLRGSIFASDGTYASGVAGVAANASDLTAALRGTFDNVGTGAAVPEPGSLVLLGSGGLCALGCWWRKRRRGKR